VFGYVRPYKPELRFKDWELFRAAYCGVCHSLQARYGLLSRLFLHYDFALLALVLQDSAVPCQQRRCLAHPFRKRPSQTPNEGAIRAADAGILLLCGKWEDAVRDERGVRRLAGKLALFLFRRKRRKAEAVRPGFAQTLRRCLDELHALEEAKSPSLDAAADTFARILRALGEGHRAKESLLYHLGRILYLLDAADDYPEDARKGRYNPILYRYETGGAALTEDISAALTATADQSCAQALLALELLPELPGYAVVENILGLGLPAALETIWKRKKTK
jgi:hypothetical protein